MSVLPVLYCLLEFAQVHVLRVNDVIQPFYPLPPPSPPAFNLSKHQGLFQWTITSGGQSTGASASALILPMNIQGWFPLGLVVLILQSKGLKSHSSKVSVLCIRWPKYWNFSFSISPFNEYSGLISFSINRFDLLQSKGHSRVFSNTTVQKHQFFDVQPSSQSNSHIHTWPQEK